MQRLATLKASTVALVHDFELFERRDLLWKPEGAAKRPHSKTGWNQSSLAKQWRPNPAEACCTMPQRAGMRSSLQGKRARLAGELHSQQELVTEAETVRRLMSNPRSNP